MPPRSEAKTSGFPPGGWLQYRSYTSPKNGFSCGMAAPTGEICWPCFVHWVEAEADLKMFVAELHPAIVPLHWKALCIHARQIVEVSQQSFWVKVRSHRCMFTLWHSRLRYSILAERLLFTCTVVAFLSSANRHHHKAPQTHSTPGTFPLY